MKFGRGENLLNIPVIYYHNGNQEYLKTSLIQCKKFNHTVYLLGDDSNKNIAKGIKWFSSDEFSNTVRWKNFKDRYVHLSSNNYTYELNCFKRFFVIEAFIEHMNIDRFVYLDSDVLCYINFSSESVFCKYDVGMGIPEIRNEYQCDGVCSVSFWTTESLNDFLNFCVDTYDKDIDILKKIWTYRHMHRLGEISDMTLEYLWYKQNHSFKKYNLFKRTRELNGIMDHNVNCSGNYKDNEYKLQKMIGIKWIVFNKGLPYFINTNNKKVRVYVIHFQGEAKQYMVPYAEKQYFLPYIHIKAAVEKVFQ